MPVCGESEREVDFKELAHELWELASPKFEIPAGVNIAVLSPNAAGNRIPSPLRTSAFPLKALNLRVAELYAHYGR